MLIGLFLRKIFQSGFIITPPKTSRGDVARYIASAIFIVNYLNNQYRNYLTKISKLLGAISI